MTVLTNTTRRLLLAGGFALAVVAPIGAIAAYQGGSVLAAVAYNQPIDRDGLADIYGGEISRDLIGRLRHHGLIAAGPRSPRPGAPHTFVTTEAFLATFDLGSLRDLPDLDQLLDAGLAEPSPEAPDPV